MEPMSNFDWDALTFAFKPTDAMYVSEVQEGKQWAEGTIKPWGNIAISPAAGVLNYGQGIFEGLKAQRTDAGEIVLFRPDRNAARMAAGAERLGMPPVPTDIFVSAHVSGE